ncbi:hypothetical protein M407DRAFT_34207 [Tulasnella calospora MUT 4182]|uniref:Uncharacterized protein n=1 Tax=Tulasnella calospora MUT 4182 TaxID=1051891 RepID=A0A0C3Q112_9AGAM|nr:hypothetical protein M407DRAFT_34207 [Tulasnella calospora MUT 4182]
MKEKMFLKVFVSFRSLTSRRPTPRGIPDHLRTVPGANTVFGTKDGGRINEAVDAEGKLIAFEIPSIGKN